METTWWQVSLKRICCVLPSSSIPIGVNFNPARAFEQTGALFDW